MQLWRGPGPPAPPPPPPALCVVTNEWTNEAVSAGLMENERLNDGSVSGACWGPSYQPCLPPPMCSLNAARQLLDGVKQIKSSALYGRLSPADNGANPGLLVPPPPHTPTKGP